MALVNPGYAASNWLDIKPYDTNNPNLLKYFAEERDKYFLVMVEKVGSGLDFDIMLGKHIALRLRHQTRADNPWPKVVRFARIYDVTEAITAA